MTVDPKTNRRISYNYTHWEVNHNYYFFIIFKKFHIYFIFYLGFNFSAFLLHTHLHILTGDKERSAFPASIRWTAPEILRHPSSNEDTGVFGTMCDVFSFGMLMWEVLIQDDPYDDIEDEAQV